MALALLLSFALGPPVLLLRRWHVNRVLAVIVVVVLAFSVIVGIGALIGGQLAHLAKNLSIGPAARLLDVDRRGSAGSSPHGIPPASA